MVKYYDLIASLPFLPHFTRADRLPITEPRLKQRLSRLTDSHAEQLQRALLLVKWRTDNWLGKTDAEHVHACRSLLESTVEKSLRRYVELRMEQQTLLAAARLKRSGIGLPSTTLPWAAGPRVSYIRNHWDEPDFHLAHLYPWLHAAQSHLDSGDAQSLERVLMDVAWRWLSQCGDRDTFAFDAVFSYVFKWDLLRSWLACDQVKAKTRFTSLVDKVTHDVCD